jgi:conjugative transfer signal peptidase TraF
MTRFSLVAAMSIGVFAASMPMLFHPTPKLIWNASASVPIGLYMAYPVGALWVGELLAVAPPEPLATFLDERRYLSRDVPLLKHVAALPGQMVCRTGDTITIDGSPVGASLDRDHLGRPLPTWQGCHVVMAGEIFLMNERSATSFDSRYFGPLPARTIVARVAPLLTKGEPTS